MIVAMQLPRVKSVQPIVAPHVIGITGGLHAALFRSRVLGLFACPVGGVFRNKRKVAFCCLAKFSLPNTFGEGQVFVAKCVGQGNDISFRVASPVCVDDAQKIVKTADISG
jgi:hypothetical protein